MNSSRLTENMTSHMTVNGSKTVIEKDTAFGEHHPECKETPLTDLHEHTRSAPEKFGLVVLRSTIHIRQRIYAPIKGTNRYS
jgi:hypothetical protein